MTLSKLGQLTNPSSLLISLIIFLTSTIRPTFLNSRLSSLPSLSSFSSLSLQPFQPFDASLVNLFLHLSNFWSHPCLPSTPPSRPPPSQETSNSNGTCYLPLFATKLPSVSMNLFQASRLGSIVDASSVPTDRAHTSVIEDRRPHSSHRAYPETCISLSSGGRFWKGTQK